MRRRDFVISSVAGLASASASWPASVRAASTRVRVLDFSQSVAEEAQFRRPSRASTWDGERVQVVEQNQPRFISQRARPLGLLLEARAENLLSPSCLDGARWRKEGMECTKTTARSAPDGSLTTARLTRPAPGKSARHTT